jgi:stage III sporulation protein AH
MTRIADYTVKEAELENLIRAKGFIDCVVYLSDSGASVTVAAEEGLSQVAVAKITDVIVSETDFSADQLNVIEIK